MKDSGQTHIRNVLAIGASTLAQVAAPTRRIAVDAYNVDVAQCIGLKVVRPRKCSLHMVNLSAQATNDDTYSVWSVVE